MLSRRSFLFMLAGGATGLWLASTGLVRLERNVVVELAGSCSFCGMSPPEVRTLLGTVGRTSKICNCCLTLAIEITGEDLVGPELPRGEPVPDDYLDRVLRRLAEHRRSGERAAVIDQRRADRDGSGSSCSFCGAERRDVAVLVSGPRVFICDSCTVEAAGLSAHVLIAAEGTPRRRTG